MIWLQKITLLPQKYGASLLDQWPILSAKPINLLLILQFQKARSYTDSTKINRPGHNICMY